MKKFLIFIFTAFLFVFPAHAAQHDYVIDNQTFPSFRADLNNVLTAVVNHNSGPTEPATKYTYMLWADTTAGKMKMWDGSAWRILWDLTTGAIDHGGLGGLADDDHTQYHTDARGDARYFQQSEFLNSSAGAGDAGKPVKLDAGGQIDATMVNDGDIDHTQITNIGTNTHAQIDSHLAASSGVHGVSGSVVGTTDTQTLSNKSISGSDNTIRNAAVGSDEIVVSGKLLARKWSSADGNPVKIEIYPDATEKPDEGNATVQGTVAWAEAQFDTADVPGIIEVYGFDYPVTTTITLDAEGVEVRCMSTWKDVSGPDEHFRLTAGANTDMFILGNGAAVTKRVGIQGCMLGGERGINTSGSGVRIIACSQCFAKDVYVIDFDGDGFTIEGHATLGGMTENLIQGSRANRISGYNLHITDDAQDVSDYRIIDFTSGSAVSGSPGKPQIFAQTLNGSLWSNVHAFSSLHTGCFHFADTGQTDAVLTNLIAESCGGGPAFEIDSDLNTFSNLKAYNLNTGQAGIKLDGSKNTITGFNFIDADMGVGVQVNGDYNSITGGHCSDGDDDCVDLAVGADNNSVIGIVARNLLGGVAIDDNGANNIVDADLINPTAAEIKTAYESNANTNEFDDAEQSKLAGIEAGADVTDETNVTAAFPISDAASLVKDPADGTRQVRIDAGSVATGQIRAILMPDHDVNLLKATQAEVEADTPSTSLRMFTPNRLHQSIAAYIDSKNNTATGTWNFGGGVLEIPNSITLPATCAVGEVYFDSDATAGQNTYGCTALNTWTLQGDGAGGGSGSMTTAKESDVQVGGATITTLDFGAGFDLAETPANEINITLDLTEKQVNLATEVTGSLPDANVADALTIAGGSIATSTITLEERGAADPVIDGRAEWDTTTETLKIGDDGVGTYELFPGAHTTDTTLSQEQVEDFAGALIGDGTGTHTGIAITYQDATGDVDFVVDHDAATNFVANEHIDHTSVTLTAGAGLSGGGDISASRSFATASQEANFLADGGVTSLTCGAAAQGKMQVMDDGTIQACDGATTSALQSFVPGAHTTDTTLSQEQVEDFAGALVGDGTGARTGISVTYQDATGDVDIVVDHDAASNFVANEHINHTSVTLTAGAGLSGGGDISANRTFTTASQEANFIADGGAVSLTCGASNQGKMQVMDDGTAEYCDGATTSVLRTIPAQHKRGFVRDLVAAATDVAVATTVAGDFRLPFSGTIDSVGCYVSTAGTTGTMTVDIHLNGTTIMTTSKITIDSAEKSSETAATAPALTTTSYTADDILTFDIDAIQTTAAKGVACWMDLLQ